MLGPGAPPSGKSNRRIIGLHKTPHAAVEHRWLEPVQFILIAADLGILTEVSALDVGSRLHVLPSRPPDGANLHNQSVE